MSGASQSGGSRSEELLQDFRIFGTARLLVVRRIVLLRGETAVVSVCVVAIEFSLRGLVFVVVLSAKHNLSNASFFSLTEFSFTMICCSSGLIDEYVDSSAKDGKSRFFMRLHISRSVPLSTSNTATAWCAAILESKLRSANC